jgi:beta-phosphoglucomutase-like phosphatase (HAD superfamily)
LLKQAASELGFNPRRIVVIGDKQSDIEFGQCAGAKTILIADDSSTLTMRAKPDLATSNLLSAARAVTTLGW